MEIQPQAAGRLLFGTTGQQKATHEKRTVVLQIDTLTTCHRLVLSIYEPTTGAKTKAERPRLKAYTDMGTNVPGKIVARYKTAPNSNTREFHVDQKCKTYNFWVM